MTRKTTHIRDAGLEIMGMLSRHPNGLATGFVALARQVEKVQTRKTLNRLADLGLASIDRRKGLGGKQTDFFALTDKGREYLNATVVERANPKPLKPEPVESDDELERTWPRKDPEETVREAVRTQPNSVFDMARVMAC